MIETQIPQSIKEILNIFIRSHFSRRTYKNLADNLGKKVDTIIQRIRRNEKYFKIDNSSRPSRISIKKGIKEVYFYRDKNKCHLCQNIVKPEILEIKYRNPYLEDIYEWTNVVSVCNECKDKELVKVVKKVRKKGEIQYKEIFIQSVSRKIIGSDDQEWFYEFDELDGVGYFPLINENEMIASYTIASILNYFGSDGWEVIYINERTEEYSDIEDFQVIFKEEEVQNKLKFIGDPNDLYNTILKIIRDSREILYIVSPFVSFTKDDSSIYALRRAVIDAKKRGVNIEIITRGMDKDAPKNNIYKIRDFLSHYSHIHVVPYLHSKLYANESEALVTSLNLSFSSLINQNEESGILLSLNNSFDMQEFYKIISYCNQLLNRANQLISRKR